MLSESVKNKIMNADARALPIPSESVHLIVTSPPYNVGMDYNLYDDSMPIELYEKFTVDWVTEAKRVLVNGGRMCVNVGNIGRKPYTRLNDLIAKTGEKLGFLARGELIWNKGDAVARGKTSWGSWKDCTNPVTRDCHEYIEVLSKGEYKLDCNGFKESDITPTEFADFTISVWNIQPAKNGWHPAAFPIEIPHRCIKLYTRPGMVVLDPFSGSGTTALAAKRLGRIYIGADMDPEYVKRSISRLGGNLFEE